MESKWRTLVSDTGMSLTQYSGFTGYAETLLVAELNPPVNMGVTAKWVVQLLTPFGAKYLTYGVPSLADPAQIGTLVNSGSGTFPGPYPVFPDN